MERINTALRPMQPLQPAICTRPHLYQERRKSPLWHLANDALDHQRSRAAVSQWWAIRDFWDRRHVTLPLSRPRGWQILLSLTQLLHNGPSTAAADRLLIAAWVLYSYAVSHNHRHSDNKLIWPKKMHHGRTNIYNTIRNQQKCLEWGTN